MSAREWRDVIGMENAYEVSSDGLVRSKPRILKPSAIPSGHLAIHLGSKRQDYVHRLVAAAFLPAPTKERIWVNHKNGDPRDNRVENLEWCTPGENNRHGWEKNGRRHPSEMRVAAVDADGVVFASFRSMTDAAKFLGVTKCAVRAAVVGGGTCRKYHWIKL